MAEPNVYITIFRAAGDAAAEEARSVRDLLIEAGFSAILVPETGEVQVPAPDSQKAEEVISSRETDEPQIDESEEADTVPIFSSQAANAELEALAIKGILDASGIPALHVQAQALPNLPHVVRVPKDRLEEAQRIIAEAKAAGPMGAEEASQQPQRRFEESR